MKHSSVRMAAALLIGLLVGNAAQAADFGIRGGVYTERSKPFVGVELLSHAGGSLYFNPNAEYVFVDGGSLWTFNFDGHWDLPTHGTPYLWLGAGLAVLYDNPDGPGQSSTKAHANLLAGVGFRTHSHVVPYIQLKLITTDPSELVAAGGIRF